MQDLQSLSPYYKPSNLYTPSQPLLPNHIYSGHVHISLDFARLRSPGSQIKLVADFSVNSHNLKMKWTLLLALAASTQAFSLQYPMMSGSQAVKVEADAVEKPDAFPHPRLPKPPVYLYVYFRLF